VKQDSNSSSPATCIVDVEFGDESTDTFSYPHNDVEKLDLPLDSPEFFPEFFCIGDVVDAKFKDGNHRYTGAWHRGKIANVSNDGNSCDVMYYDHYVSEMFPIFSKFPVHVLSRFSRPAIVAPISSTV